MRTVVAALLVAALLPAAEALACSVCFGDIDAPIGQSLRSSVLFLLGLTYVVIGGGALGFFVARRRGQRRRMAAVTDPRGT